MQVVSNLRMNSAWGIPVPRESQSKAGGNCWMQMRACSALLARISGCEDTGGSTVQVDAGSTLPPRLSASL